MSTPLLYHFVDNSNVLIEGRRFSEMKRKGRAKRGYFKDDTYEIDWGKYLYLASEKDSRGLAEIPTLYGSRPPDEDSVWKRIREDGFDVRLFDRNIRNKEKGVDIEMAMDIADLLHSLGPPRIIVMGAGDADYVPAIVRARSKGWSVEVWFWNNAAADIKEAATRFCPLDPYFEYLRLGGGVVLP